VLWSIDRDVQRDLNAFRTLSLLCKSLTSGLVDIDLGLCFDQWHPSVQQDLQHKQDEKSHREGERERERERPF
jgi:hypothetical protein